MAVVPDSRWIRKDEQAKAYIGLMIGDEPFIYAKNAISVRDHSNKRQPLSDAYQN